MTYSVVPSVVELLSLSKSSSIAWSCIRFTSTGIFEWQKKNSSTRPQSNLSNSKWSAFPGATGTDYILPRSNGLKPSSVVLITS